MKSLSSNIDRLQIATPCPIRWDEMAGNDRVRFCDHCQLNVYNISELTRTEAESLIASTEGRLCARIYRRADGTVLTKDCPVGLRALRKKVATRVAAVFAAMVSISSAAFGQQSAKQDDKNQCRQQTRITVKSSERGQTAVNVSGSVVDACSAAVPNAEVIVSGSSADQKTVTDEAGKFRLPLLAEGNYSIIVNGPGFSPYQAALHVEPNQITTFEVVLEPIYLTGDVIIVEPKVYFESKPGTTIIKGDMSKKVPIQ